MLWPFRSRRSAASADGGGASVPPRPLGEWRRLPALAGVISAQPTASSNRFVRTLPTRWQQPPVLQALGHDTGTEMRGGGDRNLAVSNSSPSVAGGRAAVAGTPAYRAAGAAVHSAEQGDIRRSRAAGRLTRPAQLSELAAAGTPSPLRPDGPLGAPSQPVGPPLIRSGQPPGDPQGGHSWMAQVPAGRPSWPTQRRGGPGESLSGPESPVPEAGGTRARKLTTPGLPRESVAGPERDNPSLSPPARQPDGAGPPPAGRSSGPAGGPGESRPDTDNRSDGTGRSSFPPAQPGAETTGSLPESPHDSSAGYSQGRPAPGLDSRRPAEAQNQGGYPRGPASGSGRLTESAEPDERRAGPPKREVARDAKSLPSLQQTGSRAAAPAIPAQPASRARGGLQAPADGPPSPSPQPSTDTPHKATGATGVPSTASPRRRRRGRLGPPLAHQRDSSEVPTESPSATAAAVADGPPRPLTSSSPPIAPAGRVVGRYRVPTSSQAGLEPTSPGATDPTPPSLGPLPHTTTVFGPRDPMPVRTPPALARDPKPGGARKTGHQSGISAQGRGAARAESAPTKDWPAVSRIAGEPRTPRPALARVAQADGHNPVTPSATAQPEVTSEMVTAAVLEPIVIDQLAQHLYGRIRGHLAAELLADRERAHLLTDL